tara:strand:+ start:558 stop:710 length:153 start_codon:yes stop_codon:yes gene_type:complete
MPIRKITHINLVGGPKSASSSPKVSKVKKGAKGGRKKAAAVKPGKGKGGR